MSSQFFRFEHVVRDQHSLDKLCIFTIETCGETSYIGEKSILLELIEHAEVLIRNKHLGFHYKKKFLFFHLKTVDQGVVNLCYSLAFDVKLSVLKV